MTGASVLAVEFWAPGRIAGALILSSVVVIGAGMLALQVQGTLGGLASGFRGVEGIGQAASAHRTLEPFARVGMVLFLLGFGVFTLHLSEAGGRNLAVLAFSLMLAAVTLTVLEGTFHARVTAWAGERWAQTGTVPELFEPLRVWVNHSIQLAYLTFGFLAMALYGWAILSTGVLPAWVGWATVAWNVALLVLLTLSLLGIPLLLFVMPVLIGLMLVLGPATV